MMGRMIQRWIGVLVCLAMVIAMAPGAVSATGTLEMDGGETAQVQRASTSTVVASGSCGEGVTWSRDADGVLTISGSGAVDDKAFQYDKTIKRLIVEPGVTAIGTYAFGDCSYLVDVTLPEGLQRIGDHAFADCLNLTGVTLPQGLQMLENSTFFGCDTLTTVTLPAGLAYVENSVFYNCGSLEEVIFLGEAPSIADNVFSSSSAPVIYYPEDEITWNDTTKLKYGGSPTYRALGTASELRVTVEDAQYRAGERVDAHLTVDLVYSSGAVSRVPGGEVQIGDVDMTVPGVKTLTVSACGFQQQCQVFVHATTTIDTSGIDKIWYDLPVDAETDETKSVTVPGADVVVITFTDTSTASELYVYDGLDQVIARFDAEDGPEAETVKVPGDTVKVRIISEWGADVYNLHAIEAYAVEHIVPDGETGCAICAGTLVCEHSYGSTVDTPPTCEEVGVQTVRCAICGDGYTEVLPATGHSWADGVCGMCGAVCGHDFVDGVCAVCRLEESPESSEVVDSGRCGEQVYWELYDSGLLRIYGIGAMYSYDYVSLPWTLQISRVVIESGVTSIGESAFSGCSDLVSIRIPESVTNIGRYAFDGCDALSDVYITDIAAWVSISFSEYSDGTELGHPFIHSKQEDRNLYLDGQLITELKIPEGTASISAYAFYGCNGITSAVIPESVTSIGVDAFRGCDALGDVHISDITAWMSIVFSVFDGNCIGHPFYYSTQENRNLYLDGQLITEMEIPEGIASISASAFYGCNGITSIVVPESVTSIGEGAFCGCDALRDVYISDVAAWASISYPGGEFERIGHPFYYSTQENRNLYLDGQLITELEIPEGITRICAYAFYGCDSITNVMVQTGETSIENHAFLNCTNLQEIMFLGAAPCIDSYGFDGVRATVWYPCNDESWTMINLDNYGGVLTWKPNHSPATDGVIMVEPDCTQLGKMSVLCECCGCTLSEEIMPSLGHDYSGWTMDRLPSCTQMATMERVCLRCGDKETSTIVLSHSYENGACTGCGIVDPDAVVQPTLALRYGTVSFESEIMYNIYYDATDLDSVVEMGLVTFDAQLTDGTIDDAVDVFPGYTTDGTLFMVATEGIAAKNMADQMWFKIYAKLTDGSYVYSDMDYYSAVRYATSILGRASSSSHMKALVVAMLDYGAEAQLFFGHDTDALANASLTAEQLALNIAYDDAMVADVVGCDDDKAANFVYTEPAFTSRYPSVSFDGAFSINFYFTAADVPDDGMTFYYWDMETYDSVDVLTPENASGTMGMTLAGTNTYYGMVDGIAAKEMDETVFVAGVYTVDGVEYTTGIIAYSLGKYCQTIAAKDTSDQQAFAQATAVYGYYAKEYFANL